MKHLISLCAVAALNFGAYAAPCTEELLGRRTFLSDAFTRGERTVAVALFDADDTLRTSRSGGFVDSVDDIVILPGVVDHLRALNARGMMVVIVSNQGGVPKYRTLAEVDAVLRQTVRLLAERGAVVNYYDFAETFDRYRKPDVGMIETLEQNLSARYGRRLVIDRAGSFMVGDAAYTAADVRPDGTPGRDRSNSDRVFAENLGVRFFVAAEFFAAGTPFAP